MNRQECIAHLRTEIRAAEERRQALLVSAEAAAERLMIMKVYDPEQLPDYMRIEVARSAAERAALDSTAKGLRELRSMLARVLADSPESVSPIRASSDNAALFELLREVGGRMPDPNA